MTNEDLDNLSKNELIDYINDLKKQLNDNKFGLYFDRKKVPENVVEEIFDKIPILHHEPEKDVCNGGEDNLLIEGDNFHILTALSEIYPNGLVDLIYIDPPYNRGGSAEGKKNDFRYNDKYVDDEDGYRHTKWLNFMETRLTLAKSLLKDDGIMFISIDDNEQAQLKMLCSSIFGEKNVEQYIWCLQDKSEGSFVKTPGLRVRKEHEYIVVCLKNSDKRFNKYRQIGEDSEKLDLSNYDNPDNDPRGPWFSGNISRNGIKSTTGSKYYTITNPAGISFTRNWTISKEEFEEALADNRIFFSKGGAGVPRLKVFYSEPKDLIQSSLFTDVHTSVTGKNELKKIFNGDTPFDYPKPTSLIKRLMQISMGKDQTIMDFFAGSGTTGQAVLELNRDDGGSRHFILCTNNENNIMTNVCYPRLKTVITGKRLDGSKYSDPLPGTIRYFKTDFADDNYLIDQAKCNLVQQCDGLLCILEDCYDNVNESNSYNIYLNSKKDKTLSVFSDNFDEKTFEEMLEKLQDKKIKTNVIYYYSLDYEVDSYIENKVLEKIPNADVKCIPSKIYDIYKKIRNDSRRKY